MSLNYREHVPLSNFTVYKIGGPARLFVLVKNSSELSEAAAHAARNRIPVFLLGAGSNILISDHGFDGLIIKVESGGVSVRGAELRVDAGVMMARAVMHAAEMGLGGFEWAVGIPGTLGGSVRGNAGCFGGEIKDIIRSVEVQDLHTGERMILANEGCDFSYRHSLFKNRPELVVLLATLALTPGNPDAIRESVRAITKERSEKQAIGTKSCGCIFKNVSWDRKDLNQAEFLRAFPECRHLVDRPRLPASFLIDAAGLKGKRIGKVFISPKHANFFVNEGGATAEQVIMLVAIAKDHVRRKFGITLEEEIQYVGF